MKKMPPKKENTVFYMVHVLFECGRVSLEASDIATIATPPKKKQEKMGGFSHGKIGKSEAL